MFCPRCQEDIQETDHLGITQIRSVVVLLDQCLVRELLMRIHIRKCSRIIYNRPQLVFFYLTIAMFNQGIPLNVTTRLLQRLC